ncbi:uncharacterized protein Tco025E_05663 [Trypanosoma conorhini]|uniref:Uncharacterized protein n=1 Tax=Trypanosoma conorhini TaxID=83891 RepID=A0A422PBC5_9TRYP|nr:uncharacterized protein Tco025E_05663 [Trypanosoma conorhini]RNF15005.1 hypothetical protein Tco025E_05663 [Trypanosoma conorhini]
MSGAVPPPPRREERLDALFDTAVEAVAELERCRTLLHDSLRAARFRYGEVQREMDRAGLLLGLAAVPARAGAVRPQLGVVLLAAAAAETGTAEAKEEGAEQSRGAYEFSMVNIAAGDGKDPAHWFASVPSMGLRECQQRFREVLGACVQVVQAQKRALAAARDYRVAAELTA